MTQIYPLQRNYHLYLGFSSIRDFHNFDNTYHRNSCTSTDYNLKVFRTLYNLVHVKFRYFIDRSKEKDYTPSIYRYANFYCFNDRNYAVSNSNNYDYESFCYTNFRFNLMDLNSDNRPYQTVCCCYSSEINVASNSNNRLYVKIYDVSVSDLMVLILTNFQFRLFYYNF